MNPCPRCGAPVFGPACDRCGLPVSHEPITWSRMAIASVVASVLWLGGIGSIVGMTLGFIGRAEAEDPAKQGGGVALAGILLGALGIVASVLVGLVVFVDPSDRVSAETCRRELHSLQVDVDTYHAREGAFPTSDDDLARTGLLTGDGAYYELRGNSTKREPTIVRTALGRRKCPTPPADVPASTPSSTTTPSSTSSPGGGKLTVPTNGPVHQASRVACQTEARTLRTAAEAYDAQFDRYPASAAQLVAEAFLSEQPTWYDIHLTGTPPHAVVVRTPAGIAAKCPDS